MIGIFDSGMGGLTVMRAIRDVLPSSDIVYFGDTKHAPYGERSRAELSQLTMAALRLLQDRGATKIVSACNSLSASLAISLYDSLSLNPTDLIEMVGPTAAAFRGYGEPVTLCATPATIESGLYQNAFAMMNIPLIAVPMPGLAGAIEAGAAPTVIADIIRDSGLGEKVRGTLILACTHYPLVSDQFINVLGEDVELFDPAVAVAERAHKNFWPQEVRSGATHFMISADSTPFRNTVEKLFANTQFTIEVVG